jgi:hypothetical protein
VREALGYVLRASVLGFAILVGPIGASDPYWRSFPVLMILATCLVVVGGLSALLFRREWRAAMRAYGVPAHADSPVRPA